MKVEIALFTLIVIGACAPPEDAPPTAPDPIGEELLSFSTALGVPGCERAHLYRAGQALQLQCLAVDDSFSWENRGTLSLDGKADLEAALLAADFDNTAPGDDDGLCDGPESGSATMTLWVGDESFSYSPACPTEGVQALHDITRTILGDISECAELDLLESVEPGCRPYWSTA